MIKKILWISLGILGSVFLFSQAHGQVTNSQWRLIPTSTITTVIPSYQVQVPELSPGGNVCANASGTLYTSGCSGGGGGSGSSTVITGVNGVTVTPLVNGGQTSSLNTTYAATWTALETFVKGVTINGTTTLASTTNSILYTDGSGHVLGYAGSNVCSSGFAATAVSATGTITCSAFSTLTTSTLNGLYYQIANNLSEVTNTSTARTNLGLGSIATHPSTDYLPSSTVYVVSVNGQSGAVTLGIPATSTITASGTMVNGNAFIFGSTTDILAYASGTTLLWQFASHNISQFTNNSGYITGVPSSTIWGLFSNTATGLTYTNSTGVTSLTSGYFIPLTASGTQWNAAYASSSLITSPLGTNAFNSTAFSTGTMSGTAPDLAVFTGTNAIGNFSSSTTSGGSNCLQSVTISASGTLSNTNTACSGGGGGLASTTPWTLQNPVVSSGTGVATISTGTLLSELGAITSSSFARAVTKVICASNALDTTNCDYKATGTNDQTVIQSAITAVAGNSGHIVLSDGIFHISAPITVSSSQLWVSGQGWGTELLLNNSISQPIFLVNSSTLYGNDLFSDIQFNGNAGNQTSSDCFDADGLYQSTFNHDWFTSCYNAGLYLGQSSGTAYGYNNIVEDSEFDGNGQWGLVTQGNDEGTAYGNKFIALKKGDILDQAGLWNFTQNTIQSYGSTSSVGVYESSTSNSNIINNTFDSVDNEGIKLVNANNTLVSINKIYGTGDKSNGSCAILVNGGTNNNITGNNVSPDGTGTSHYTYDYCESNNPTNTNVATNIFEAGASGTYQGTYANTTFFNGNITTSTPPSTSPGIFSASGGTVGINATSGLTITGNITGTGNLTIPSQIQFNSTVYTQFQAEYANLDFKALDLNNAGQNKIIFTATNTDVMAIIPTGVGIFNDSPTGLFTINLASSTKVAVQVATSTGDLSLGTSTDNGLLSVVNASNTFALKISTTTNATSSAISLGVLGNVSSSPTAPITVFQVLNSGHVDSTGTIPTLSSCGTSPTITGSDAWGTVTVGSVSATGCTVTFQVPYEAAPSCMVTNESMSTVNAMTYSETTSALTVSQTGLTGDKIHYWCGLNL